MASRKRKWRVSGRVRRVGLAVGLAAVSGVAAGSIAGPVGGLTAASAVASAAAAIVGLWRAEHRDVERSADRVDPLGQPK